MVVLSHVQTLCDPMDCSPPGSSVHGILQAGIVEWVAMPSSRGPSGPRWGEDYYYHHWLCSISLVSSLLITGKETEPGRQSKTMILGYRGLTVKKVGLESKSQEAWASLKRLGKADWWTLFRQKCGSLAEERMPTLVHFNFLPFPQ